MLKETLETIVKKANYAIAIPLSLIAAEAAGQNIATIQSRDVPSLKNSDAKITLANGSNKYWGITDSTGTAVFNVSNGTYNITIESDGTYKIIGQRTISGNSTLQFRPIEKKNLESAYYPDNLHFFKLMTASDDPDPNHFTHQTNPSPIRFFNDPTNMPSYAIGVQDSILDRLTRKTNNAVRFRKATTDSVGIRTKYVPMSGMPPGYSGDLGATALNYANTFGYFDVSEYLNTELTFNQEQVLGTLSRETGRMLSIEALSQDPNMVMHGNAIAGGNVEFTNDEYWLIETAYKITPLTNMLEYIDSVVVSYNLENPAKPSLVYPANHATDVPTNTTFRWNKIDYQGVTSYDFQIVSDTTTLADLIEKAVRDTTVTISDMPNKVKRYWRTTAINTAGQTQSEWNDFNTAVTGVEGQPTGPNKSQLYQNYPNPFNPSTTIKFELPKASHVTLTVYDILGREVAVLVNERRNAGVYEVKFDGSNLASGVYFYRIQAGDYVFTKKLLLMK